jgi:hypothetical protein
MDDLHRLKITLSLRTLRGEGFAVTIVEPGTDVRPKVEAALQSPRMAFARILPGQKKTNMRAMLTLVARTILGYTPSPRADLMELLEDVRDGLHDYDILILDGAEHLDHNALGCLRDDMGTIVLMVGHSIRLRRNLQRDDDIESRAIFIPSRVFESALEQTIGEGETP